MNPSSKSRSGGREPRDSAKEVDTKNKVSTPDADMQAEDAGTPDAKGGRGRAAEAAMKQQSKTGQERGSRR